MESERLDVLLAQRGLVESRERAKGLIMAAQVLVDGQVIERPGARVSTNASIHIVATMPFVSRGGIKLDAAMKAFGTDVRNRIAADVGASTGGFTDCLLQRGACRVYAVDVGYGQLAWKLRQDSRVVVMERVNARYLTTLPEPVDLVTMDVSFISLKLILENARHWLSSQGQIIALIKPQFEAGRREVSKGGVVRDPQVHRSVLLDVLSWAQDHELYATGLIRSPLLGPAGNVEFLTRWVQKPPADLQPLDQLIQLSFLDDAAQA